MSHHFPPEQNYKKISKTKTPQRYIVDCVSHDSNHVLCGIWQYKKIYNPAEKSITYEYAKIIESRGEIQDQLFEYMKKALDAVDRGCYIDAYRNDTKTLSPPYPR